MLAVLAVLLLLGTPTLARAGTGVRAAATGVAPLGASGALRAAPAPREFAATLSFAVDRIAPTLFTATSGTLLTIRGTVRNAGTRPVSELQYVVQRGDRLTGPAAVSAELAAPSQPQTVITRPWTDLIATTAPAGDRPTDPPGPATLAPGASAPFVVSVDIGADDPGSLAISQPGAYPIMVNVNGSLLPEGSGPSVGPSDSASDGNGDSAGDSTGNAVADAGGDENGAGAFHARLGELHLITTVLSVPAPAAAGPTGASSGATGPTVTIPAATTASGSPAATQAPGTAPAPPPGPATPARPIAGPANPMPPSPVPMSMIWPVVDRPHLGLGGVFLDDELAASIRPGGRLAAVLDALERIDATEAPRQPATAELIALQVDPELLDELDRMSRGYRVLDGTAPQPALVPTAVALTTGATATPVASGAAGSPTPVIDPSKTAAAGAPTPEPTGAAGTPGATGKPNPAPAAGNPAAGVPTRVGRGSAAAASFLLRLRTLAGRHPVIVLPYGDPDVVAMSHAGQAAELAQLSRRGRGVAGRLLGTAAGQPGQTRLPVRLLTELADPIDQLVDPAAVSALRGAGFTSLVVSLDSLIATAAVPTPGAVLVASPAGTMPAAVAGGEPGATMTQLLTGTGVPATTANGLLAVLGSAALTTTASGVGPAVVLEPDRRWTPGGGATGVAALAGELAGAGALTGTTPAAIAARADPAGPSEQVDLPVDRAGDPIPASYLNQVQQARQWIARMNESLIITRRADTVADPAVLLNALDEGLQRVYSTAFRADPTAGQAIIDTVNSTIEDVRLGVRIRTIGQYTLTSADSPLQISVANTLPYDVRLSLAITGGDRTGLNVTQPGPAVIPAGRVLPFKIVNRVSRSGTFTVAAVLLTGDGADWTPTPTRLTISSSAYGVVTVVIIIVAGVVLLLMVSLRLRQRLRARSRPGATADPESAPGTGPERVTVGGNTGPVGTNAVSGTPVSGCPIEDSR